VVASTTAIATSPGRTVDFLRHAAPASTQASRETRAPARQFDRVAPADRDSLSVARQGGGPGKAKAGGQSKNHASPNGQANGHAKQNAGAGGGKPASPGKAAPPPQSHAGGNGNSHAGGNGKSQGKN
jgi:hypothetical protein